MMVMQGIDARGLGTVQLFFSEQLTEEDLPMLRLRLACLTLASGLLFTLSGCCSFCEEGRLFPRLFHSSSMSRPIGECECHSAHLPQMMDATAQGPILTTPGAAGQTVPIPITNLPTNQPPQIFKAPQAAPTPYVPSN
jgi:hypothetical protein